MVERSSKRGARRWWVRTALVTVGVGAAVAAFGRARPPAPPAAPEAPAAPAPEAAEPAPPAASDSDYTTRPVAFIGHDTVITREELGEFLVLRRGADKVDLLVNRRIIDLACAEAGVEVTAAEVEASLGEDLKGLGGITRNDFVKQVLRRYGKSLAEWKEDVIRPKLLLAKLSRARVQVGDDDVRDAFEARYGEKVECRVIQWASAEEAEEAYRKVRDSEEAFSEQARRQKVSALASTGGKIKPLNRHLASINPVFSDREANERLEAAAFALRPGEVSGLLAVPGGRMVLKCDRRLPADTTVNPAAVRDELIKEVTERKTLEEMPKAVRELRAKADPKPVVGSAAGTAAFTPGSSRGRVVAYIHRTVPVTREDLGEFLITRYGPEALELLVNKRIIEEECKAKGVSVDSAEFEVALQTRIAAAGGGDAFKKALADNRTSLQQYKEDVLKPQLQLTKLSAGRVKATDEDLKAAYEAYYGEKVECRIILWPKAEQKYAMAEYAKLRDSETAFGEKARSQSSPELARYGGHLMEAPDKVRLIGRHTLGNPEMERELFSLQPGEVSKLIETPEGIVVMKCDRRLPPDGSVSPESVRDKLLKEVTERKTQLEIPLVFAELRKRADPRLLLKDPNKPTDLTAEVSRDLRGGAPPKPAARPPQGN